MKVVDAGYRAFIRRAKPREGRSELLKYLEGSSITKGEAILAKCYDCMGMTNAEYCDMPKCALYKHSQYRGKGANGKG